MTSSIPDTTSELYPFETLSKQERLRLLFTLMWPCFIVDLPLHLLHGRWPNDSIRHAVIVLSVLLLSTWVVRRTVRCDLPGFHLVVVRGNEEELTRAMNYWESLRVTWLMLWRTVGIYLLAAIPAGVAFVVLVSKPNYEHFKSYYGGWPEFVLGNLMVWAITYFWILKAMINAKYSGFQLRVERTN